jgi:hypothetical protein
LRQIGRIHVLRSLRLATGRAETDCNVASFSAETVHRWVSLLSDVDFRKSTAHLCYRRYLICWQYGVGRGIVRSMTRRVQVSQIAGCPMRYQGNFREKVKEWLVEPDGVSLLHEIQWCEYGGSGGGGAKSASSGRWSVTKSLVVRVWSASRRNIQKNRALVLAARRAKEDEFSGEPQNQKESR